MKLAFVPPRFGPGVLGGSEAVSREAALGFAARGYDVEVLTTCALDHFSWANELPEGTSEEDGLLVRRFPVVRHPSRAALQAQLAIQSGRVPDLDHQVSWLGFQFGAPALFEYLLRCGVRYDAVVLSPYLFWTTSVCLPAVAERAVVVPCLHDEEYARLESSAPSWPRRHSCGSCPGLSTSLPTGSGRWRGATASPVRAYPFRRATTRLVSWSGTV